MVNIPIRQKTIAIKKLEIYQYLLKNPVFCKKNISADLGRRAIVKDKWFQIYVTSILECSIFDFEGWGVKIGLNVR